MHGPRFPLFTALCLNAACLGVPDEPGETVAGAEASAPTPSTRPEASAPPYVPPEPRMIPDTGDTVLGNPAPSEELRKLGGGTLSIAEHRGKPVLLSFWASWCRPCRAEMPQLDALYKEYGQDKLVVVGVNIDREEAMARKWLSQNAVSFPIALDPEARFMGSYGVSTMPTSFVIDKRGVVVKKTVGFRREYLEAFKALIDGM